jgi:hypothetical protein
MRLEAVVPLQLIDRGHGIMTVQVCAWRWSEAPEVGPAHPNAPELS